VVSKKEIRGLESVTDKREPLNDVAGFRACAYTADPDLRNAIDMDTIIC
jgi:hypothetical protein